MKQAYLLAYELGCKGITVYRDGSRDNQVLDSNKDKRKIEHVMPRDRPDITTGTTEKIQTGCGKLYVTINSDVDGFCEVFCTMGRSCGCTASQSEAISRLASLALCSGVDISEITHQLKGIRCPSPIWSNGELILSCADAVGRALQKYSTDNDKSDMDNTDINGGDKNVSVVNVNDNSMPCPDCGGMIVFSEGCATCKTCGYSKCGG